MNIFEQEKKKEFETIGFKNQQKSLSVSKQVGGSNFKVDEKRRALLPGKRVSKSGKIYWETRRNRSDSSGSKV